MKKHTFEKLYKELFCISTHEKLSDKVFQCRMAISLLTILACTVVMAASTFALFYSEVSTDHSTIASAYYSVTVDNAENGKYICPLVFEDKHTFVITAYGTATMGYCKIQIGEQVYYTEQIPQGSSLTLTVHAAKDTPIIFTPQWGYADEITCKNIIEHSNTPYVEYTVETTATLDAISDHYGVSAADILIFNGIAELTAGKVLKIPCVTSDTLFIVATQPPASTDNTPEADTINEATPTEEPTQGIEQPTSEQAA